VGIALYLAGYLVLIQGGEWEEGGEWGQLCTWLSAPHSSCRVGRGGRVGTALYLAIRSSFQLESGKRWASGDSSVPGNLVLIPAREWEEGGERGQLDWLFWSGQLCIVCLRHPKGVQYFRNLLTLDVSTYSISQ